MMSRSASVAVPAKEEASMAQAEVPVLIVGGSLVGLSSAMALGHHGVASLAVERHAGTAVHPATGQSSINGRAPLVAGASPAIVGRTSEGSRRCG
jgi:hypothetical protein